MTQEDREFFRLWCACSSGKTTNTAIKDVDELGLEEGLAEDEI